MDAGHRPVQRGGGRGAGPRDADPDPGGLPGQRHATHPVHLHEQVHHGRLLLPLRCPDVQSQVRLLVNRGV